MTDNEIIKALECCSSPQVNACDDCPFHERCYNNDEFIEKEAIDLINRQKAEIEQLEKDKESFANSYAKAVARNLTIKAEAVKEFAERLKKEMGWWEEPDGYYTRFISPDAFDNLVKEMVGENNAPCN